MSVVYKITITRPNLDSLCFLEGGVLRPILDLSILWIKLPPYIGCEYLTPYEPMITWSELYARKSELRPDLLFLLDSIGIESIISNPNIYAPYPSWNPLSLSWTRLIAFDTVVDALTFISLEPSDLVQEWINTVGSTVTYEELLIDGIPDPTFVKKY